LGYAAFVREVAVILPGRDIMLNIALGLLCVLYIASPVQPLGPTFILDDLATSLAALCWYLVNSTMGDRRCAVSRRKGKSKSHSHRESRAIEEADFRASKTQRQYDRY
jgi:hypothetical protein